MHVNSYFKANLNNFYTTNVPVLFLKTNISVQLYILIHIPVYIYFCIINLLLKRVIKYVYQNKSTGTRTGIYTHYTKKFSATLLTKILKKLLVSFSLLSHIFQLILRSLQHCSVCLKNLMAHHFYPSHLWL